MNFDGTYPDTSSAEDSIALRKADKEKEAGIFPKTVVYNSDVANTRSAWSCTSRWRLWLLASSGFLLFSAATALVIIYLFPVEELPMFQNVESRDQSLAGSIVKHVRKYYRAESMNRNLTYLQEYFEKEQERLENTDIDTFVSTLDSDFILSIPNNEYERMLVVEGVQNTLLTYNNWIKFLVEEEEELSSYNFQVSKSTSLYTMKKIPSMGWTQSMIQTVENQRKEYLEPIFVKDEPDSVTFSGRVLIMSKIVDILNSLPSNKTVASVIAQVAYMDANLTKRMSMSIFATNWVFITPVTINLSGSNAIEYQKTNYSLPGRPGQHGGFFLGIGQFDKSKLTVKTNGGNGSSGVDGANGRDGKGGRRPDKDLYKNKYDCEKQIQGEMTVNVVGEKASMVRVYDSQACGEAGTPGGAAGKGGRGGAALLINGEDFEIIKGIDGEDGLPGKDGIDGKSEVTGACYFTAWKRQRRSLVDNSLLSKYDPVNGIICEKEAVKLPLKHKEFQPYPTEPQPDPQTLLVLNKAVTYFSAYARERVRNLTLYPLFPALHSFEDCSAVVNLTTPLLLINEMKELNSTDVEVLTSFQNKEKIVSDHTQVGSEERQALQYLRATIRSKISVSRYSSDGLYVVNIAEYLDQMINNVKSLDIKFSKKSLNYTNALASQIADGLHGIAEALDGPIADQLTSLIEESKTDQRILQLSLNMAKASSILLTAVTAHLSNSTNLSTYENKMNSTLDNYLRMKKDYQNEYSRNQLGEEKYAACAEMFVHYRECSRINTTQLAWQKFRTMDEKVIGSFRDILNSEQHIQERSAQAFEMLSRQLRSSLALNEQVKLSIELLRENFVNARKLLHEGRAAQQRNVAFDDIISRLDGDYVFADPHLLRAVEDLKNDLLTNLLRAQYFNAYVAYQQWAFPYTDTVSLTPPQASKEEIINAIEDMKDAISATRATIQSHDKDIKQAEFSFDSPTGPFYTWKNLDYSSAIGLLFKGHKIRLAARIADSPHLLSKQAIKFKKINLIFTGKVHEVLKDFTIQMTHSGFSHYFFRDNIHVKVGPAIPLEFSYGSPNPTVYNAVYRKIVEGDIMLSPYTTWTIQLNAISNKQISFDNLKKYIHDTDVHLVGEGWYVHED